MIAWKHRKSQNPRAHAIPASQDNRGGPQIIDRGAAPKPPPATAPGDDKYGDRFFLIVYFRVNLYRSSMLQRRAHAGQQE